MMSKLRVVVKPSASPYQPGSERRFEIVEDIHDDQGGGKERFKRCVELMQPSGQRGREFLLLRRSIENLASWGRDLRVISQLRHEHLLGYRDAWQRSDDVSYTLYDVGRLFLSVCLREMGPRGPSGQVYPRWMYHVISALEYLHDQNNADQPMLHRAVQPDNILITDHCVLKLCAFHNGKRLADRHGTTSTVYGGGDLFQSPEISEGKGYNQAVDIWGFGVTVVYMANYDRAGKAMSPEKLLTILRDSGQDGPTVSLVERCLRHSPQNRPTASHIVRELRKSYGEQWLKGDIPKQDLPLPLVNRLKQDSGRLPHTLSAQHATLSTSSEPQRNTTTTTPVTTPLPAHPTQHTPQSHHRSTSTSASTGRTASDSAKRVPRESNLPLERNVPKAVGKRRHDSSCAKPHMKNLDPVASSQQVSTGEDVFTEEDEDSSCAKPHMKNVDPVASSQQVSTVEDVFTEEDEDTGTAGEERYRGSLNRPSHVRASPQTTTTKSEVRTSSELVDSETQTSLYHHHHKTISTQTSQIHNTNVTTRTGEERKKKKKSQGVCPESGESGRERPRSSRRSLMTSPGRSTGTGRLPRTSSVTPASSVHTVADSPAASSDGHGTYEDLRIQLEKVQTMYQDNCTSDCTTPTLSPQPHIDERLHFSHPLRSPPPPPVPRPRTRNCHSRAHTVPACCGANLSDDIRKGLTKYKTDKVKTVSNSNTNDTNRENTSSKPDEPEDEDIAPDRPSHSKQRVRRHPKEEEQNDENIKREIRSVRQNQVNPGKQRMREDEDEEEDDEDRDDGQRRSGQHRPVPGPRPDRRRTLPTDRVDHVLDKEVLIKIAQSVKDRKRQPEQLRFKRRAKSRPSEEPPRDPSHQDPKGHNRGQGQEVRGDRSARPRARHVPQDDLDLPHVETDGATSGLGDSCHSQELLDY